MKNSKIIGLLVFFFVPILLSFSFAADYPRDFMFGPNQKWTPSIYTSNHKINLNSSPSTVIGPGGYNDVTQSIIGSGSASVPGGYYSYFMSPRHAVFNGYYWLIFQSDPSPTWSERQGSSPAISMSYVDWAGNISPSVPIPTGYNNYDINALGFYFFDVNRSSPVSDNYYPIISRSPYTLDADEYPGIFLIASDSTGHYLGYFAPDDMLLYKWYFTTPSDGYLSLSIIKPLFSDIPDSVLSVASRGRRTSAPSFGDTSYIPIGQEDPNRSISSYIRVTNNTPLSSYPDPDFGGNNPIEPTEPSCSALERRVRTASQNLMYSYNTCLRYTISIEGPTYLTSTGYSLINQLVSTPYSGEFWRDNYYDFVNNYPYKESASFCQNFYDNTMKYLTLYSGDNFYRAFNPIDSSSSTYCSTTINGYNTGSINTGLLSSFSPIYKGQDFFPGSDLNTGFSIDTISSGLNIDLGSAFSCLTDYYGSLITNTTNGVLNLISPGSFNVPTVPALSEVSTCVVNALTPNLVKDQFFSPYLPVRPVCENNDEPHPFILLLFYSFIILFCLRTRSLFTKNPWHTEPAIEGQVIDPSPSPRRRI